VGSGNLLTEAWRHKINAPVAAVVPANNILQYWIGMLNQCLALGRWLQTPSAYECMAAWVRVSRHRPSDEGAVSIFMAPTGANRFTQAMAELAGLEGTETKVRNAATAGNQRQIEEEKEPENAPPAIDAAQLATLTAEIDALRRQLAEQARSNTAAAGTSGGAAASEADGASGEA
jgi:hypothetical protein